MAWIQVHGESSKIGMNVAFHALIPQFDPTGSHGPAQEGPYKVIYLLHGYSDNSAHWLRMTAIEREMTGRPIAVILPETDNAFWLNTRAKMNYFDYLADELPELCGHYFPISDKKEDTMIAGFSMGGFGALHAALNRPEQYGYCAAFAPVTQAERLYGKQRPLSAEWFAGDREAFEQSSDNLFVALKQRAQEGNLPKMMLTVGNDDGLKPQSEAFAEEARKLKQDVILQCVEGHHDWYFAEAAFLRALRWFETEGK